MADGRWPIGNQFAQARRKAGKFLVHAVFVCGWFSATAGKHGNTKHSRCKGERPAGQFQNSLLARNGKKMFWNWQNMQRKSHCRFRIIFQSHR
jgi:hypothetical protein